MLINPQWRFIFFSRSNCPGSGLSVCSNFSFERGFLVSQAHLPELASSCSTSKKEFYSSIHNEDRFFWFKAIAQAVKCPLAPTFLGSEVFLWARHIFVNSFPVVVRNNYINQSITMIDFSYLKQLSRQCIVRLLQLFLEVRFSCEPDTSSWICYQL